MGSAEGKEHTQGSEEGGVALQALAGFRQNESHFHRFG